MKDVEDFAAEHDLHDIVPDLKKGALVAQNPADFDKLEEFSPEQKEALRFESLTNQSTHFSYMRPLSFALSALLSNKVYMLLFCLQS
jgi:hypothetical protein